MSFDVPHYLQDRSHGLTRFDIIQFGSGIEDEPGMLKTVRLLNEIITAEVDAGIPANRIIIGGFSQGGAMSLLTGLTTERKLGGIVAMSAWLPLKNKIKAVSSFVSSAEYRMLMSAYFVRWLVITRTNSQFSGVTARTIL